MFNASQVQSPEEAVIDLSPVLYPDGDQAVSRDGDLDDANLDKNFAPTPYLPPYLNPSRYPTVFGNYSNSTFEVLFQFTPTLSNLLLLAALVGCTLWVISMNLLLIGALRKAHERDREHVTDMYLINLLFADVLVGIFVFPFMSIVILIGYFPLSASWCNLWVYFDYYLIIASSYGFAALMSSYLMMVRWPEFYPKSRRLHSVIILFIWIFSNAPWTAPFINDRVSFIYPDGVCGFSIQKNRYFTFYIGVTGLYFPLGVALVSGIFAVKYLKESAGVPFFRLLLKNESCHVHPITPSPAASDAEFNDLYHLRRGNNNGQRSHLQFGYPRPGLSPPQMQSESTDRSDVSPSEYKKQRYSLMSVRTFHRNKALYDSVRKHFPLVATSLILFVLSRSLFYTYFGIGAVVPHLFPPDLSHSVYWVMHSYAVAAPVVHLLLDPELRRSVVKFVNEGTFSISHHSDADEIIVAQSKPGMENVLPKVSVIDAPRRQSHHNHHHHHHHRHEHSHQNHKFECNGAVGTHDAGNYPRHNGYYK